MAVWKGKNPGLGDLLSMAWHILGICLIPLASSFEFNLVGFYMSEPRKVELLVPKT